MRKIVILAVTSTTFGAILSLSTVANALTRQQCELQYKNNAQLCKDNGAGGKNFGVALWSNDQVLSCIRISTEARTKCVDGSITGTGNQQRMRQSPAKHF